MRMESPNTATGFCKHALRNSSDGLRGILPTPPPSAQLMHPKRSVFDITSSPPAESPNAAAGFGKHALRNSSDGLRGVLPTPPPSAQQMHPKRSVFGITSSPPAESSSGRNHPPYDVFISHCGTDTKLTVATNIYKELNSTGLRVFLDKDELKLGDFFPRVLEDAIAKASLHIAIFSANYARSRWCLDELESMLQTNAIFIPIFYYIEPSDLRWVNEGKGIYADAFSNYEKKNRYSGEKLQSWKSVLEKVSYYNGKIINNQCDEKDVVMNVATCVLEKLKKIRVDVAEHPVGLDEVEQEFNNIVLRSTESIQIVGIWGMGGSGKTTLAKHIFNKKFSTINTSSFLFDVRDAASKGKLHKKQKKLVEDLKLEVKNANFDNIDEGKGVLRSCWRHIPVLVVLDDVDNKDQLDALLPPKDILCPGSMIIVTTRELHVLKQWDTSVVYQMRKLNCSYAMELFSWHAFGQPSPFINFKELAKKFIDACGGLPLSLKVIGSLLHGELRKEHWESQLDKLSRIGHDDIKLKLKISYDALDDEEKEMFLDITCFFIGCPSNRAIATWDGSGWSGLHGWQRLVNKCLAELDIDGRIRMHDHLRDLGREIANKQSPYRLWSERQIIDIQPQQEAIQIRGITDVFGKSNCYLQHGVIRLKTSQGERILSPGSLGLKILISEGDFIDEQCSELSSELLCFHCYRFPHKTIPSWLHLKNLRSLELREPLILEDLWECDENAPLQLRHLEISEGYAVKKINALRGLGALETLQLKSCTELETLPSLAGLTSLKHIALWRCEQLEKLEGLEGVKTLETLTINFCEKLKHLPSLAGLTSLKKIDLSYCKQLEKIEGLEGLKTLETLRIAGCEEMKHLPSLAGLTSLKHIELWRCEQLEKIEGLEGLKALEKLTIHKCGEVKHLPSLAGLTSLKSIILNSCNQLEKIESLEGLKTLKRVFIGECTELKTLPKLSELTSLEEFILRGCEKVEKVEGLEVLRSLKRVKVHMSGPMGQQKLKLPEQSERLKRVELVGRRIGEVEPSTREMQKWAREEIICTMGVIDVRKLLSSDYRLPEDVLHTYSSEYLTGWGKGLRLKTPESDDSANKNAILMCFSIHPKRSLRISGKDRKCRIEISGLFSTRMENLAEESIWVWMGIFPEQSDWLSSQEYMIQVYVVEEEEEEEEKVEVKEGWLMRGREQSIREAFHHLISHR